MMSLIENSVFNLNLCLRKMMNTFAISKYRAITVLALSGLLATQSSIAATEMPAYNKYYDIPSRNVLCQAGHLVTLYDNGYLQSCTVADGTQLQGKTGGNGAQFYACSSSQPVVIYADGFLNRCIITNNIQVGGHNAPNGTQFYTCKANSLVEIKEDGYLSSCTLASPINVYGRYGSNTVVPYTCKENASLELRSDGYLSSCTLAGANWVQSSSGMKMCNAGSVVYIDASGNGSCGN
ncbi:hypothetical protein [Undibacterium sp. Tian12W]|uniref:hypothetical protein n=1 Tax=Undibacterium sp. Tian12W TaxID=3413054 RepID=UPI003BF410F9